MRLTFIALILALLSPAQQSPARVPGIPGVVASTETVELVKEGFVFTEGPVGTSDGGIYFTDVTANQIQRLDANGKFSVFHENSNGANGLAITRTGEVIAVEGSGKRVSRIAADGRVTVVTEGTRDKPLLAPNDLILDTKGAVYFTDPGPRPVPPGRKAFVYYLRTPDSAPVMLDDAIGRPNGLTLTRNGKTLIVDDTMGNVVYAFDVQSDGTVKNKRTFATLVGIPAGMDSGADGLAVDREDRLYVTTVTGIQVFDKTGKFLATIPVPRQPSNVAFAGRDKKTLYITAREGLYRLRMLAQGPDRPGK